MTTDQGGEVEIAEETIDTEVLQRLRHHLHEESHRVLVQETEIVVEEEIGEEGDQDLNPKKKKKKK